VMKCEYCQHNQPKDWNEQTCKYCGAELPDYSGIKMNKVYCYYCGIPVYQKDLADVLSAQFGYNCNFPHPSNRGTTS